MSGQLMLDLETTALSEEERELLQHPMVGGVIFFSRNYESPEQMSELTDRIKAINPQLLLAVDQEGGRVQRFKDGFTRLPPQRVFGRLYDKDPQQGLIQAEMAGWVMAMELLSVGIDFSFAPVLDLDLAVSEVIGDRAFHSDPKVVTDLAQSFIHGMLNAGMQATGKHFPGHGSVAPDSHADLPIDERDFVAVHQHDMQPFLKLAQHGLTGIMPAHIIFPKVDKSPVGFSSTWLQDILRKELGFNGVIFSDDLSMEGAAVFAGSYPDRARLALEAGCDMILICNHRFGVCEVLDAWESCFSQYPVNQRLLRMQGAKRYRYEILQQNPNWQQAAKQVELLQELINDG